MKKVNFNYKHVLIIIVSELLVSIVVLLGVRATYRLGDTQIILNARSAAYDTVCLDWNKIEDADGYRIYRSTNGGEYEFVTNTRDYKFEDHNLITGAVYRYMVRSFKGTSNGSYSASAEATPVLDTPSIELEDDDNHVIVKSAAVPGADGYKIYRDDKLIAIYRNPIYVDEDVEPNVEHTYRVSAYKYNKGRVYSEKSEEKKIKLVSLLENLTAKVDPEGNLFFRWDKNDYYTSIKIYRDDELIDTISEEEYEFKKVENDVIHSYTFVGIAEDEQTSPSITRNIKIVEKEMSSEDAAIAAADWAIDIANDNSFTYGTGPRSHRFGCFFCGNNIAKKGLESYEKTYCCNPFVTAAYAHGACDPALLRACKKGSGLNMNTKSFKRYGNWENLGKPAYSDLKKGDVLVKSSHMSIYAGDGQVVHAASEGWGPSSILVQNASSSYYNTYSFVMRYRGKGKGVKKEIVYL